MSGIRVGKWGIGVKLRGIRVEMWEFGIRVWVFV